MDRDIIEQITKIVLSKIQDLESVKLSRGLSHDEVIHWNEISRNLYGDLPGGMTCSNRGLSEHEIEDWKNITKSISHIVVNDSDNNNGYVSLY